MRARPSFVSVRPHLGVAIAATLAVVVLPGLLTAVFLRSVESSPPPLAVTAASVLLGLLIASATSAWWSRKPQAKDIGFGELMLWGWWRRKRAEDRLVAGTRSLGLDPSGRPAAPITIGRDEQVEVLKDLTAALESKDPYTHGHSRRVERHSYRTAAAMGLAIDDIEELRKAAALHDVGKVRVPDSILRKPGPLSTEERGVLEDHSIVGAWMVSTIGSADVVAAVRHHHERWDGRGYPDGLVRYDIPLYARIIAVADAYDALTSTRPYRAGVGRDEAVAVLRAEAGIQFDPNVVEAFVACLPDRAAVASLLALLAFPSGLIRRAALTAKRVGMTQVAPAIGATGAAVLIGSSAILPAPALPSPARAPVAAAADDASTSTAPAGPVEQLRSKKAARTSARHQAGGVRAVSPSAAVLGERYVAPRQGSAPPSGGSGVLPGPPPAPPPGQDSPPAKGEQAPPAPDHETTETTQEEDPQPAGGEEGNDDPPNARSDPQPEKGKDCPAEENDKGEGKGHEYHCG